jgi:hypothetical protein
VNFAARAGLAALPGTSDIRLVHLFFMANVGVNLGVVAEGWFPQTKCSLREQHSEQEQIECISEIDP